MNTLWCVDKGKAEQGKRQQYQEEDDNMQGINKA